MSDFGVKDIRNIALVSHVGTGKTTLADAFLFDAKINSRLGKVDDGSSMMDYEPEETKRKTTISSSIASFDWQGNRFNIIDTPGSANFIADTKNCMQAVDSAVIIYDSIDGPKIQSNKLVKFLESLNLPACIFINKMDRENSNYKSVLEQLNGVFSAKPVLVQFPIGEEEDFRGLIDIISQDAYFYKNDESGINEKREIPIDLKVEFSAARESSIESIVECDDEILEMYLEGQEIPNDKLYEALKKGIDNQQIIPILFGSATKNIGIEKLLSFSSCYMPSPQQAHAKKALKDDGQELNLEPNIQSPLAAQVFKTIADPYAGQLTIMRVYSGEISSDSNVLNSNKKIKEKIGQMFHLVGKNHNPTNKAIAGDIVAVAKLKDTHTKDTLCSEKLSVKIPMAEPPVPVISFAIKPKGKGDEEKISTGLKRLMEEDTTLKLSRDEQTKEMILSGMGQVHLDIVIEKLQRKFGAEVILETPKIPYRETITGDAKVQSKYKKQTGGKGQYGDCQIELHSISNDQTLDFVDKIVGGAIPRQYIPAVENGIKEAMKEGILAGFPVVGVQTVLFDGSYHPVDSSEMAFKIAGSMAFKKAALDANPILLEPIMQVEITVPEENVGDIMGDLNGRRGRMLGIDAEGVTQTVKAEIPMAEMLKYAADLNSMTSGAGVFSMEFARYEEVPAHIAQKVIEEFKKNKAA